MTKIQVPPCPVPVQWADGSPASHDDYKTRLFDTHTFFSGTNALELQMYADIVADLRYNHFIGRWTISGVL